MFVLYLNLMLFSIGFQLSPKRFLFIANIILVSNEFQENSDKWSKKWWIKSQKIWNFFSFVIFGSKTGNIITFASIRKLISNWLQIFSLFYRQFKGFWLNLMKFNIVKDLFEMLWMCWALNSFQVWKYSWVQSQDINHYSNCYQR